MTTLVATVRHARYVVGENPVTGLAFALFVLIVLWHHRAFFRLFDHSFHRLHQG